MASDWAIVFAGLGGTALGSTVPALIAWRQGVGARKAAVAEARIARQNATIAMCADVMYHAGRYVANRNSIAGDESWGELNRLLAAIAFDCPIVSIANSATAWLRDMRPGDTTDVTDARAKEFIEFVSMARTFPGVTSRGLSD